MYIGSPFRVVVTADKGLNIILSNRSIEHERTYAHFLSTWEGAFFVNTITKLMAAPMDSTLECCTICGKHFLKKDKLCQLINGAIIHRACFYAQVQCKGLEYDDLEKHLCSPFSDSVPEFEFSNFGEPGYRFRFAVEVVSEMAVHLYCRDGSSPKHHFVLTKQECLKLTAEITRQLDAIKQAEIGDCFYCGKKIYIDQERYEMRSGELVHARCMDKFIQSDPSAQVTLPARKIHLIDRFSHAQLFPQRYRASAFLEPDQARCRK